MLTSPLRQGIKLANFSPVVELIWYFNFMLISFKSKLSDTGYKPLLRGMSHSNIVKGYTSHT